MCESLRAARANSGSVAASPASSNSAGPRTGPSLRRTEDIARIEQLYGKPREASLDVAMRGWEFDLLRYSKRDGRYRDATILIPWREDGGDPAEAARDVKLVCIVKHGYPEGVARPPSGGVVPGEPLDSAAEREALEETGLRVRLTRYLVRVRCRFRLGDRTAPPALALAEASRGAEAGWVFDEIAAYAAAHPPMEGHTEYWASHVFWAVPVGGRLAPLDTREVKRVELVEPKRLEKEIHEAMRSAGIGGFDYRVELQSQALAAAREMGLLLA